MNPKVIIINGSGGCGKSTFVKKCTDIAHNEYDNLIVVESSTVDKVKEVAQFCGWDGTKTEKNRAFLHDLKMALEKWNNIPNQSVVDQINSLEKMYSRHDFVIFVNIREADSIRTFIENCQDQLDITPKTLLIRNANVKEIVSNDADKNVENFVYDYLILNNGTLEELEECARNFLKKMLDK